MANPNWFDDNVYMANKLAQVQATDVRGQWTAAKLADAFTRAGFVDLDDGDTAAFRHFKQFGQTPAEDLAPNAWFNANQYYAAKYSQWSQIQASQLNDPNAFVPLSLVSQAQADIMKGMLAQAGFSAWSHYWAYGSREGINPSNAFDASNYCQAKADIANANTPGANWTAADVAKAIHDAGFTVLTHFYLFAGTGADEVDARATFPVGGNEVVLPNTTPDGTAVQNWYLTTGQDLLVGTANSDDFYGYSFNQQATFQDGDVIDGGAGYDTLYADVWHQSADRPMVRDVEKISFSAQQNAPAGLGDNNVGAVHMDAERITATNKNTFRAEIYNDNSRGDFVIEDVRFFSHLTTVGFSNTDSGDVDFGFYYDQQHLRGAGSSNAGILDLEIMDTATLAAGTGRFLLDNYYTEVTFHLNGERITLKFGEIKGATATYANLRDAIQTAIVADGHADKIVAVIDGTTFTAFNGVTGERYPGQIIKLQTVTGYNGTFDPPSQAAGDGWGFEGSAPPTTSVRADMAQENTTACPLIATDIVLDNVGRVLWEYCDPTSRNYKTDYGSEAGDMVVGSMATRGGVERFNVTVEEGSWLSSLASTNNALKFIQVVNGAWRAGAEAGNLYIGDKIELDVQQNAGVTIYDGQNGGWQNYVNGSYNMMSWQDAPLFLEYKAPVSSNPANDTSLSGSGLKDVAWFDASTFVGDVNIAVGLSRDIFDKYLKGDTPDAIDNPTLDTDFNIVFGADDLQASYRTGSGNDTLNIVLDGYVAADPDFRLTVDTGAGNDCVRLNFEGVTNFPLANPNLAYMGNVWAEENGNWQRSQQTLNNVLIQTGAGNDYVLLPGAGHVRVETGTGNDKVFTDNTANRAVYVLNAVNTVPSLAVEYNAAAGVVPVNNNVASMNQSFTQGGLGTATVAAVTVTVEYLGVTNTYTVNDLAVTGGVLTLSDRQVNQIIKGAVNAKSPYEGGASGSSNANTWLSEILIAKDGAGHSLILESLTDGLQGLADLQIGFSYTVGIAAPVAFGALNAWYNATGITDGIGTGGKNFGTNGGINSTGANANNHTDNRLLLGTGDDLAVLATGVNANDTITLEAGFGRDTIVNFQGDIGLGFATGGIDFIDLTSFGIRGGAYNVAEASTFHFANVLSATAGLNANTNGNVIVFGNGGGVSTVTAMTALLGATAATNNVNYVWLAYDSTSGGDVAAGTNSDIYNVFTATGTATGTFANLTLQGTIELGDVYGTGGVWTNGVLSGFNFSSTVLGGGVVPPGPVGQTALTLPLTSNPFNATGVDYQFTIDRPFGIANAVASQSIINFTVGDTLRVNQGIIYTASYLNKDTTDGIIEILFVNGADVHTLAVQVDMSADEDGLLNTTAAFNAFYTDLDHPAYGLALEFA